MESPRKLTLCICACLTPHYVTTGGLLQDDLGTVGHRRQPKTLGPANNQEQQDVIFLVQGTKQFEKQTIRKATDVAGGERPTHRSHDTAGGRVDDDGQPTNVVRRIDKQAPGKRAQCCRCCSFEGR